MEKFFHFGYTIGTRGGVFDSVITNIRSGWSKFRVLVPFLASKGFLLGTKYRLYSVLHIVSHNMKVRDDQLKKRQSDKTGMMQG